MILAGKSKGNKRAGTGGGKEIQEKKETIAFSAEQGTISWRLTSIMEIAGLTSDAQDQLIEHNKGMYDAGQYKKASEKKE